MRTLATKQTAINQYNGFGNQLWDIAGTRPSLDLQFADRRDLVDATTGSNLVNFTRASSGTYVGSDGLIKRAVTNLVLQSENLLSTPNYSGSGLSNFFTATLDSLPAPNGSTSQSVKFVSTATTSQGLFLRQTGLSLTAQVYTLSIYLYVPTQAGVSNWSLNVDFQDADGADAATSTLFDQWVRVEITKTLTANRNFIDFNFRINGGAAPNTAGITLYAWGAQLEQSSTVGEYVKTTSTINSAPRFDHDPTTGESLGLLVEEQRTNLVTWSQDFSQTDWGKSAGTSIVSTAIASPISGVNYQKIEASTANTTVGVTSIAVSAATQQRAVSFFARPLGNITRVLIVVQGADARINVNLINGTATTNATATGSTVTVSGERFTVSTPSLTNATGVRFFLKRTGETDTNTPTTIAIGEGLYLTGAQMEAGSFPTSYIPTEGSTVTRAADVASISGSNFSSWYRQDEGTVFAEFKTANANGLPTGFNTRVFQVSNGTSTNRYDLYVTTGGTVNTFMNTSSVSQLAGVNVAGVVANNSVVSVCFGYKNDNVIASADGTLSSADTSCSIPATSQLNIGSRGDSAAGALDGAIRRLTYWPARLPNETLQTITQ